MNQKEILKILDIIRAKNVRPRGHYISLSCPFAHWQHEGGEDIKPSMAIYVHSENKSWCKCFTCGWSSTLSDMLKQYNKQIGNILNTLVWQVKLSEEISMGLNIKEQGKSNIDFRVFDEAELDMYKGHIPRYVLNQGITLDIAKEFELGYDKDDKRVVFPIRNNEGQLVGLTGKSIVNADPKYIYYWRFSKGQYLYGEHKVKVGLDGILIVVEGIMDAIALYGKGITNIVSIMGNQPSKKQIDKLKKLANMFIIYPDKDAGGQVMIDKFAKSGLGIKVITPLTDNPRKATTEQLNMMLNNINRI